MTLSSCIKEIARLILADGMMTAPRDMTFDEYKIMKGDRVRYKAVVRPEAYLVRLLSDKGDVMGELNYDNKREFEEDWK